MNYAIKIISFLFFILSFIACGFDHANKDNQSVKIEVEARDYKNQSLQFEYPFSEYKIKLDSNGVGRILLPVKAKLFVPFTIGEKRGNLMFLEPGYNISLLTQNKLFYFKGIGAEPNNYILKIKSLLAQFVDSINVIKRGNISHERFVNTCNKFEAKFNDFHTNYSDSTSFSEDVNYLLKNNTVAFILAEKQNFLNNFSKEEIDSLNMENKLGLVQHQLFQDTMLIKANSSDFKLFLFTNSQYINMKKISADQVKDGLYPVLSTELISNSSLYSIPVKEFLLFANLSSNIQMFGPLSVLDSIAKKLIREYPTSDNKNMLSDAYKQYENLTLGSIAPDFKGISPEGKSFSLKDFNGKIVFIDVWATWCGPCIKGFPVIYKLIETSPKSEFIYLFVSIDKDKSKWEEFLSKQNKLMGVHIWVDDPSFMEAYKISGIPRYIIVNKNGKIVNAFVSNPEREIINVTTK